MQLALRMTEQAGRGDRWLGQTCLKTLPVTVTFIGQPDPRPDSG